MVLSFILIGRAGIDLGSILGTILPFAGIGIPVGIVSPLELINTKEELSFPGVNFFNLFSSTGITMSFSEIGCTFELAFTTLGFPTGTTLPSGLMSLPAAGIGTPVLTVSPTELISV